MQSGSTPKVQDYFSDLNTPNIEDMQLQLEEMVLQGQITPEQAQAAMVEASAMKGVSTDPSLRAKQMQSIAALDELAKGGGMTASDEANLARIQNQEQTAARGAREAIMQNAAAKGVAGSGLDIMNQLKNQQESATRQSQRDLDVAGMAQDRALQALIQGGETAGNLRTQDFSEAAKKAEAEDAIAKFNAANKQQVNLTNTAANNSAQAANLAEKQRVSEANVAGRNAQQKYNKELYQLNYENELRKRQGRAGISSTNATNEGRDSQNRAATNNQMLGTALQAGAYLVSDETAKTDIEDFSAEDFLDKLTAHKYKYKDPKNGSGSQMGVMAQDLLKSETGKNLVEQGEEGLMINTTKATGPLLASVADLNKRLKKVEGK